MVPVAHSETPPTSGTFSDVTQSLGISIVPAGDRGDWGHGCAFVDYDGDGVLELYAVMGDGQANRFFQLQQDNTYLDIAPAVGCADGLNGRTPVFADYDNDGDIDFFLSNHNGPNRLYQNQGDGSFIDVAFETGVDHNTRSHSAGWADYNNDGYLDLFVCVYGTSATPLANLFYEANGDGTFLERAGDAGVADADKPALAMTWIDYDNDGLLDIYIAYDKYRGNTMYRNNGDGTFTDKTGESNTDMDFNAMGVAVGDFDNNGYFDMYITNTEEGNELLQNNGDGTFAKVAGFYGVKVNKIGWGCAFFDYDNDGDDDLYVVNWAFTTGNPMGANNLFQNNNGTFVDRSAQLGADDDGSGYGLTVGDYNNDGYQDIFINNMESPSVFLENAGGGNKWIKIKTVGTVSNRDGIGARVRVTAGPLVQHKDVRSGSSYLSQVSPELDYGLAAQTLVNEVQIVWPSGIIDTWTDVAVNQSYVATEGGSLEPVPVFITSFVGATVDRGVRLRWEIAGSEDVIGFRLSRRGGSDDNEIVVSGDSPLAPTVREFVDRSAAAGRQYGYALTVLERDGSVVRSPLVAVSVPERFTTLAQNSPNPFNPTTTIAFTLANRGKVRLDVYDAAGRFVTTLADDVRDAGPHSLEWDGSDAGGSRVGSGVYFYRLVSAEGAQTRKMVLLK